MTAAEYVILNLYEFSVHFYRVYNQDNHFAEYHFSVAIVTYALKFTCDKCLSLIHKDNSGKSFWTNLGCVYVIMHRSFHSTLPIMLVIFLLARGFSTPKGSTKQLNIGGSKTCG